MGTHPAHELGLALYQFYRLCHFTSLLSRAGRCFAAAINALNSSTHPTECFTSFNPCQRDHLNNPKKLFWRLLWEIEKHYRVVGIISAGGSLALGRRGSRGAGFGVGPLLTATGLHWHQHSWLIGKQPTAQLTRLVFNNPKGVKFSLNITD